MEPLTHDTREHPDGGSMFVFGVYYCHGVFLVPTRAQTTVGVYMDAAPVVSVPRPDEVALRAAVKAIAARPIPIVPHPPNPKAFPKPVVLQPAGVKTWAAFEKRAIAWTIEEQADAIVVYTSGRAPNGRWGPQGESTVRVDKHLGIDGAVDLILTQLASRNDC